MESLFFGHVKGSFTGALRNSPGLLREADHGVLFLDEIADMDYNLQAKLLRVLEDGLVRPVGSRREYKVDVHIITATSRDLRREVRQQRFREELFHRVNVLELRIPPLRERPEDIPLLIDHFLRKYDTAKRRRPAVSFAIEAIEYLQRWPWPGNVRELENLVRRVIVLSEKRKVDVPQLKRVMAAPRAVDAATPMLVPERREIRPFVDHERQIIRDALIRTGWNRSKAARLLSITRGKLLRRIEKLKITPDGP
jgi:DNA-binding NtrC family response regulator